MSLDVNNQAAIIDAPMKAELTGQGILTASFLAGAGEEKVLAAIL